MGCLWGRSCCTPIPPPPFTGHRRTGDWAVCEGNGRRAKRRKATLFSTVVDLPHKLPEGQYPQHSHLPGMDGLIKAGVKNVLELCVTDVESLRYKQELVRKILHTGSLLPKRKEPPALSIHLMSGGAGRWKQEDAHFC